MGCFPSYFKAFLWTKEGMDEPDLRQIRVVNGNNEVQIKNAVS